MSGLGKSTYKDVFIVYELSHYSVKMQIPESEIGNNECYFMDNVMISM